MASDLALDPCNLPIDRERVLDVARVPEFVGNRALRFSFQLDIAPKGKAIPVTAKVLDPQGAQVANQEFDNLSSGKYDKQLELPASAQRGEYRLILEPKGSDSSDKPFMFFTINPVDIDTPCPVAPTPCAGSDIAGVVNFRIYGDCSVPADPERQPRLVIAELGESIVLREAKATFRCLQGPHEGCPGDPRLQRIAVSWDTLVEYPEGSESVDVIPIFVFPGSTDEYPPTIRFGCDQKVRINNSTPELPVGLVNLSSLPQNAAVKTGKVLIEYTVRDNGGEPCDVDLELKLGSTNEVLRLSNGTLTELTGQVCDGVLDGPSEGRGPVSTSRIGDVHRIFWNSDYDLDRLVCEGKLPEPRVSNVNLKLTVTDVGTCKASIPVERQFILDNTLVHSVAGLVPGQRPTSGIGVPLEEVTFETVASIAFDQSSANLFIADSALHGIYRFDMQQPNGQEILEQIAGTGGRRDELASKYDNQLAVVTPLNQPLRLEDASDNGVYFVEGEGGCFWRIDPNTSTLRLLLDDSVLEVPNGFALDEERQMAYVLDSGNCRLLSYDLSKAPNWSNPPAKVIAGVLRELKAEAEIERLFTTRSDLLSQRPINGCNYIEELIAAKLLAPGATDPRSILNFPAGMAIYPSNSHIYGFIAERTGDRIACLQLDAEDPASTRRLVLVKERESDEPLDDDARVYKKLCGPTHLSILNEAGSRSPYLYISCSNVIASESLTMPAVKGIVVRSKIVIGRDGFPELEDPQIVAGLSPERPNAEVECGSPSVGSNYRSSHECLPATDVSLSFPCDVIADGAGNRYVADSRNQRVRRIGNGSERCATNPNCDAPGAERSNQNRMTTFLGGSIEGISPCEHTPGGSLCAPLDPLLSEAAIASKLSQPIGMALVDDERIYVADRGNHRIRLLDLQSGMAATIAGKDLSCDEREILLEDRDQQDPRGRIRGDGGPAANARFAEARGIAVYPAGAGCDRQLLYVADFLDARVRRIDLRSPDARIVTIAGSGDPERDQDLSAGESDARDVYLKLPKAVVADSRGRLFVSDCRHRIVRIDDHGDSATISAAIGDDAGLGDEVGECPDQGLDPTKPVSNGNPLLSEQPAAWGDGGPAISCRLNQPSEMAFDAAERFLYIADSRNNSIRRASYDRIIGQFTTIVTIAGTGDTGRADDWGPQAPALETAIRFPYGVALAPDGRSLYCTETFGLSVIFKISLNDNPTDNIICIVAGGDDAGATGDGAPALQAQFNTPNTLQVDCVGNIYVLDSRNNRLRRFYPLACGQ